MYLSSDYVTNMLYHFSLSPELLSRGTVVGYCLSECHYTVDKHDAM